MRVSVIIPAWNLWSMTAACLRSLAEHSAGENLEVLVVDNGSTDATVQALEPLGQSLWAEGFKAVRLPENMGFAKACNAGAHAATGELLFFLNNDTTLTPGWLPPLRAAFTTPRLGAAGPLLLYPDGTVQHCGVYFTPLMLPGHLHERFQARHPLVHKHHPLQAITGAAFMLRRAVFAEVGGFFEVYANGFEDVDLCLNLGQAGYKLAVVTESVVYHHTSQTPGRFTHEKLNIQILMQRWGKNLRPDYHRLAAMDGYELQLDPALKAWLALPQAREAELNAAWAGTNDVETLREALAQEPHWAGGWHLLVEALHQQGLGEDALTTCAQSFAFCGEYQMWPTMLRLARRYRSPEALAHFVNHCGKAREESDTAASLPLVREARRRAYARNDTALAQIFDNWLLRYARPASTEAAVAAPLGRTLKNV